MKEKILPGLFFGVSVLCGLLYNPEVFSTARGFQLIYFGFLYASLFLFCSLLFARWKKVGAVGIFLLHGIGLGVTYFYWVYGRILTYDVLAAMLEANAFEIKSFLSIPLVFTAILAIVVSAAHAYLLRFVRISNKKWIAGLLLLVSAFLILKEGGKLYIDKTDPESPLRTYLGTRNIVPLSFFSVFKTYWVEEEKSQRLASLPSPADLPSECGADKPIVVLVLGESARGDHFSLNGYQRKTNPQLEQVSHIINLGIARSFAVQTRNSLIGMLTNATEENRVPTMGSFIPLFNKHGFMTCFYSRQNRLGRSGHLTDALIGSSKEIRYFHSPTDQDLLKETEPLFKAYPNGLLLLLHTTGSHYDYRGNYTNTFKVFVPDEYTPESMMAHRQNVINAYDNTIVKTDDFLAKLYAQLKGYDAIVVYVSDHGQLLGEHGRFLHAIGGTGTEYPEQKNIPFFFWYSELFAEKRGDVVAALKQAATSGKTFTHDYLYHTIIALGGIRSKAVEPQLDITGMGSLD